MESAPKGPENRVVGLKKDFERLIALTKNEKLKTLMRELYPVAKELLKKREKMGPFSPDDAISHFERSSMLLGLADQLKKGMHSEKTIDARLKILFPIPTEDAEFFETEVPTDLRWIAIKQMLLEADMLVGSVDNKKVEEIIKKAKGDRSHIVNAIAAETAKDSIRRLIESGDILDKDGRPFLQLPFTADEAMQILRQTNQQFDAIREKYFMGMATRVELSDGYRERIVIVFSDATERTIVHEKKHRDYPGLSEIGFRISLNEMVTETLARAETGSGNDEEDKAYEFELAVWNKLGEALQQALLNRYKNYSVQAAEKLAVLLMEKFGPSNALELSLAIPARKSEADTLYRELGVPSTKKAVDILTKKS